MDIVIPSSIRFLRYDVTDHVVYDIFAWYVIVVGIIAGFKVTLEDIDHFIPVLGGLVLEGRPHYRLESLPGRQW